LKQSYFGKVTVEDELEQQVKELQRLVGKQAMTIEILEAAREVVKKSPHLFRGSAR